MSEESLIPILETMFTEVARSGPVQMRHSVPERWVQLELYRRLHDDARFTDVVPGEPPFRSDFKPKKKRKEGGGPPIFFVDFFARFAPENTFVWGELKVEQRKEGKSRSRTLKKPGWAKLVTEDAARLLQLRLDQTAAHWRAATEYWHTRCLPGLAERLATHEHRFFCAYLEVDCARGRVDRQAADAVRQAGHAAGAGAPSEDRGEDPAAHGRARR